MPPRKWKMPAAEEQGHDNGRASDHGGVFAEKEKRELHRAVFGVITADQLRFGFRKIERQSICFGEDRDRENNKRNEHRNREQPLPTIRPIADEWRDHPAILDLITDNAGQAQLTNQQENRDDGESERE